MERLLAIDFGTTNTVVASRPTPSGDIALLSLPGLSHDQPGCPPVVPSRVYVHDGHTGRVALGQAVIDGNLAGHETGRLFRDFKRAIVSEAPAAPRLIDGTLWSERQAAERFLHQLFEHLPFALTDTDQLVVTAPVLAFETYLAWLDETLKGRVPERVRIVDEATAAALGYAVTDPGARVLVFDFGGGTLDLALVQLPEANSQAGGLLKSLLQGGRGRQRTARVMAKAGRLLGGGDVDQWLLAEVLTQAGLGPADLGDEAPAALMQCEKAKIALSAAETTSLTLTVCGQARAHDLSRTSLERLLEHRGFFAAVRQTLDQCLRAAHRRGIFKEDVTAVLMVGGMSLMPSVQRAVQDYFGGIEVRVDKPFTAVVEGALQLAAGLGLQDYLLHGYGLRHWDPATGAHRYDELIPMGSPYPLEKPVEVTLAAAHAAQQEVELIVGEMALESVSQVDLKYEEGQAVFVGRAAQASQKIQPLNADQPTVIRLNAPCGTGQDCLLARFTVDAQRQLRLEAIDLRTRQMAVSDVVVTALTDTSEQVADSAAEPAPALPEQAAGPEAISGREPCLSIAEGKRGKQHLSLRGLATLLVNLPPEAIAIEAAAQALCSSDHYVRYSAAESLGRRGDREARLALQDALTTGAPATRASVAHHLCRLSWFAAEPLIRQAFRDEDTRVHECAVYGLCNQGDANAYALLCEILPGEGDNVRLAAAWGLRQQRGEAGAIPVLAIALQAQTSEVRVKALESLGETGLSAATPVIRPALSDLDPEVVYAATLSLLEVNGEACLGELASLIVHSGGEQRRSYLRGLFHGTNYLLMNLGASTEAGCVLEALDVALHDPAPATRMAAAAPLAWMRHPAAASRLERAWAEETDSEAQAYIITMAFCLASDAAETLLQKALQSQDERVRSTAEMYWRDRVGKQ